MRGAAAMAMVLVTACAPASSSPPSPSVTARIDRRVTIAEGASLAPDDPAKPGEADPTSVVVVGGKLYATLANLFRYAPAGPSFLGVYDPTSLAETARVPLEKDGIQCRQAMAMIATGDGLLVACAGRIAFPPDRTADGALVDVSLDGEVRRIVTVGRSPGSVTRVGDDVWLGDGEGGGVSHVAYDSFDVLAGENGDGMIGLCQTDETKAGFVADVTSAGGRTFASCFNDDAVQELNPRTGAKLGGPIATGSGPLHFGLLASELFVLDDLGGTMSRILPTPERASVYLGEDGTQGGNDPQGVAGDASLAGVTNSAYGTFAVVSLARRKVVAAVDLKPSPDAPTNFPGAVAWDGHVFFVAVPGLDPDARKIPSELVRVEVSSR